MKKLIKSLWIFVAFTMVLSVTACNDEEEKDDDVAIRQVLIHPAGPIKLKEGETREINVIIFPIDAADKTLRWESNNPMYVTVDNSGIITAVAGAGNATITVTSTAVSSVYDTIEVEVEEEKPPLFIFDVKEIAGKYDGTISGQDVVATLTFESETKVSFSHEPFPYGPYTIDILADLNVSMNDNGEYILEGEGRAQGLTDVVIIGKVGRKGEIILDIFFEATGSSLDYNGSYLVAENMAGTYNGTVSSGDTSIPDVEATITVSGTTIEIVTDGFTTAFGNTILDFEFTVSMNEDGDFILEGSGGSNLIDANSVEGTADRKGNIVISWDFGPYGVFTYTGTLK